MATFDQLPGELNVAFIQGDNFSALLDFSIDTTGYTLEAEIYSLVNREVLGTPNIEAVDEEAGQWNLSIDQELAGDLPAGTLGLRIRWTAPGDILRNVLDGVCEVKR